MSIKVNIVQRLFPLLMLAAMLAISVHAAAAPVAPVETEDGLNLARVPGTASFGNGNNGPFLITKINDGRTDSLGMWCTNGVAGSFGGVKLGEAPVTSNTVRFLLFNGRAAFNGWRIEGSPDVEIDEDSNFGTVYDPELIATDSDGEFANSKSKDHNVVTVSFAPASYKFVRLLFPNKSGLVGVPELMVFNSPKDLTPQAVVSGQDGAAVDNLKCSITISAPLSVSQLLSKLKHQERLTISVHDTTGATLKDADVAKNGSLILVKSTSGGGETPFKTEYKFYTLIDSSAPPSPPKVAKVSTRPPSAPKPQMSPAAAPDAPGETINLVEGKKITASIDPARAAALGQAADANWFAQQRYPQWFSVDLGEETTFDFVSIRALSGLSLQHFWIRISSDGATWKNLVEVDHVRKNNKWNGVFEKTKARYVQAVLVPPSSDVHIRKFIVANLAKPLVDKDGKDVPVLKPVFSEVPDFSTLPKAASSDSGVESPRKP